MELGFCHERLSLLRLAHNVIFATLQETGLRRGKVLAAADQFAQLVAGAVEALVGQSVSTKLLKQTSEAAQPVVRHIPLPPSIIANHEPFRHGEWRQEPYTRRCVHFEQPIKVLAACRH